MLYVPNPAFVRDFEESLAGLELRNEAASKIAERAQAIAPVDSGEYRDSIHVEDGLVVADSEHAVFVEFGTIDTPTFAPLRRAAIEEFGTDALGGGDR